MEMKACDADELQQVSKAVHDAWFEKTDIRFHSGRQVTEIPIRRENWHERKVVRRFLFAKKITVPVVRSMLSIRHVQSCEIEDRAHIGTYDIMEIRYHDGSVVISSNFPFAATLRVSALEVSLVDTDEIVEEKAGWALF